MRLDNFDETALQNREIIRLEDDGLAVNSNHAWFDFRNGSIAVKNTDEEIIRKMLDIAGKLKVKMQGEESEMYNLSKVKKVSALLNDYSGKANKPWWKYW